MPPAPRGARISYGPRRLPGSRRIDGTRAILPRPRGTDRWRAPPSRRATAVANESAEHADGRRRPVRGDEQVVLLESALGNHGHGGLRETRRGRGEIAEHVEIEGQVERDGLEG